MSTLDLQMNLSISQTKFKTLKPGEPGFVINDRLYAANRAGFEISNDCPIEYQRIIGNCLMQGWLIPIATMHDYEYTMDKLKETQ